MGKKGKKQGAAKGNLARQLVTIGVWLLGRKYRIPIELLELVNKAANEQEAVRLIEMNLNNEQNV